MLKIAMCLALGVAACGGPAQLITKEHSNPTRPAWLTTPPRQPGQVYVVGVSSRVKTLAEGKHAAHQNATVQVAAIVGTKIRSESESRLSTEERAFAKDSVKAQAVVYVKNLVVQDEYWEKTTRTLGSYFEEVYDVWILARFPLKAADEERKRQAAEHSELTRDALKRYSAALSALKRDNPRQARVALMQARETLRNVPPLTELHEGKLDTAQDLLREVDRQLLSVDELARGVRVSFAPGDRPSKKATAGFTSHLTEALRQTDLIVRTRGKARFVLELSYSSKLPKRRVMGQQVGYLTYAGNVSDTWSGATLPGTSGEVKGFGKSPEAALNDAAQEASKKIAKGIAQRLKEVLDAEVAAEG